MAKRFKIGIDARFYGTQNKGLGRYVKELVDRLVDLENDCDYVLFLNSDNIAEAPNRPNVKKVLCEVRWYSLKEQIKLPFLIAKEKLDLIHYPHFNHPLLCATPFVVTIHDLILFHYPTRRMSTLSPVLYWFKMFVYHRVIKRAILKSKKILTVSEHAKQDILKEFSRLTDDKIIVTYEGLSDVFVNEKTVSEEKPPKPYWLYVGNAYPHKNLAKLLTVFKRATDRHPDWRLILVGKDDYFYQNIKRLAKEMGLLKDDNDSKIVFPGYLSDHDLNTTYSQALGFIFPSLYEGFGIPPLEAMSRNCPVLSSNRSCMPEVLGDAAMYFDPEDENDMLKAMETLTSNDQLRNELIAKGRDRVKLYSWQKCVEQIKAVYLKLCATV